ncbi:pirin family protein [Acidovorax sp. NCPPB 2350]|nr:pirin family protein [Acidovorax sp. NCPPB 2350]
MLTVRKSCDRGHADHGWLRSCHSFSFAGYRDARYMGFGNLRVLNEDWIAPGTGFGMHRDRDVEIVSYMLSGRLAYRDCRGRACSIPAGDVLRIGAGTGISHGEVNEGAAQAAHFLQIRIAPCRLGVEPQLEQVHVPDSDKRGRLHILAAPRAVPGALTLNADARIHAGLFDGEDAAELPLDPARKCYVHMVRGALVVNGHPLSHGDAVFMEQESLLSVSGGSAAEVLVLDLAA